MKSVNGYVIGIDVGSSRLKCYIYDSKANVVSKCDKEIKVRIPKLGHNELDPNELWVDFQEVFRTCIEMNPDVKGKIRSMGISVQRNSFMLWDRKTSVPLTPIISWQDTRSAASIKSWNDSWRLKMLNFGSKLAYIFTGSNRYFAASILNFKSSMVSIRLHDMLRDNPELLARARSGEICYGCIETWLVWCLTKGKEFSTDVSCASATGVFDPFIRKWSDTLLNLLNLPKEILPEVKNTVDYFGETSYDFLGSGSAIPINCVIGDSQAATVGVGCVTRGSGKVTLGTGSFLTIHTGDKPHVSMAGLYPLIGHRLDNNTPIAYFVEGYHPSTGSTIDWLRRLDFFKTYDELETILNQHSKNESIMNSNDLYFVPAFMGLQVPINDPCATGLLIGLSPTTLKTDIVYSVIEAIPMSIRWILDAAQKETGIILKSLRVNGSVSKNKWIIQRISDLTGLKVEVCQDEEASCNGAAFLAATKCGFWQLHELPDLCHTSQTIIPDTSSIDLLEYRYHKWKMACARSLNWKS